MQRLIIGPSTHSAQGRQMTYVANSKQPRYLGLFLLCLLVTPACAETNTTDDEVFAIPETSPVEDRIKQEEKIPSSSFAIAFYKPTYLMPYYFTGSPYYAVYKHATPNNERLSHVEMKYQLSFKVPVWKNIFHYRSTLNLAYTQLSYWQAYNRKAFFRETDYEPEIFIANEVNCHLFKDWMLNFINMGAVHQSNGFGNHMERSWNRIYIEIISSTDNWMFSLKPWYIVQETTVKEHNPHIAYYLGYGQFLVAYKYHRLVFTLQTHNLIEAGGKHATAEFAFSFPLSANLNAYLQVFSGYGQSLIEYNHRTNSVGLGIAFSNWV